MALTNEKNDMINKILMEKIIVIIRGLTDEQAMRTVETLADVGIMCFEFALDNESDTTINKCIDIIGKLNAKYRNDVFIGAGTVMNADYIKQIASAGARFVLSPNYNEQVVKATCRYGMVSIPGAVTPSEIVDAYNAGGDIIKVFPAGILGAEYVKSIKKPIHYVPFAAVGGIDLDNIGSFWEAGTSCFGIGNSIVDASVFQKEGSPAAIDKMREKGKKYIDIIHSLA